MRDVAGEREAGRGGFAGAGLGRGPTDRDRGAENEAVGVNTGGEEEARSGRSVFVRRRSLLSGERARDGAHGYDASGLRRRGGYD